ncbi:D-glycero-beta-D-manno-heptose 1-phosphate adenylyltransferase [Nemorincola caseinilytica]|uniref:D-glycero-beta-D-manno-heptose 1-phosphate adenylyltransferase n=1 Tax=Nemorincola caseinilytica TaxID=2054315 RepID=A0ABP8NIF5_9BACT
MDKLQWIQRKIFTRDALLRECNGWRVLGHKIVFTNGCFDILHHGHLDLLARAASLGNKLVIGVNTDASVKRLKGPTRPVTHEQDRLFQLASLLCTDAICLFDEDTPKELIELVKPDILVKGGDYTIDKIVGADTVQQNGGQVHIIPFVEGYSTTSLIDRIRGL